MNKQIVLASNSPRRSELLNSIKLDFIVHPPDFTEKLEGLSPEELAKYNALGKAQSVARHYHDALVIGVDTLVVVGDHILGKPKNTEDHKHLLRLQSGATTKVISGLTVLNSKTNKAITLTETTLVTMDRFDERDIEAYIASNEGSDKAGGYAIQGLGALFIKKIDGDYFNVVGLPVYRLRKVLEEFGIDRWI